jgi:hypothetical protein
MPHTVKGEVMAVSSFVPRMPSEPSIWWLILQSHTRAARKINMRRMNRLKLLPWTQILLFLLLVVTIANYFELRSLDRSIILVDLALRETGSDTSEGLKEVKSSVDDVNDKLDDISDSLDCMAHHLAPCGDR